MPIQVGRVAHARRGDPAFAPAEQRLGKPFPAKTPEEATHVAAARQRMTELLHVPVVKRGVIMPDACPSGGGRATIPVGGAIEVENAIIPGAHSADICCSMFATFFPANHPVGEMMDHLQKTTHFGPGGRPRGYQMTSPVLDEPVWDNPFLSGLRSRAQDFLGTQGDGNHFAYVGRIQFATVCRRHQATWFIFIGEVWFAIPDQRYGPHAANYPNREEALALHGVHRDGTQLSFLARFSKVGGKAVIGLTSVDDKPLPGIMSPIVEAITSPSR